MRIYMCHLMTLDQPVHFHQHNTNIPRLFSCFMPILIMYKRILETPDVSFIAQSVGDCIDLAREKAKKPRLQAKNY